MLYYYFIFIFLVTIIYLSEIAAFFWHRYGTHQEIVPHFLGVQESHHRHHTIIDDQAHGDFLYILLFLIILAIIILYLIKQNRISYLLGSLIYFPILLISIWNWYIHAAYHIENHWLNRYAWFQNDKRIHFQHHRDPSTNYGIATHFTDVISDTFDYGLLKID